MAPQGAFQRKSTLTPSICLRINYKFFFFFNLIELFLRSQPFPVWELVICNTSLPDSYTGIESQEDSALEFEDSVVFVLVYEFQTFFKCLINKA